MQTPVILQPKKTFEEFQDWFSTAPIRDRMTIENVTMRDMGVLNKEQLLLSGSASVRVTMRDMYEQWYLMRWIGNN